MKKTISIFFAIALALNLSAETVNTKQAVSTARQFFKDNAGTGNEAMTLVRTGHATRVVTPVAISDAPTYYVYNRQGGGWVIIAADDCVNPILGYSFTGEFPAGETIPDNLRWWLDDCISVQIAVARAQGYKAPKTAGNDHVLTADGKEYETALWDQGAPYNGECPIIQGVQTITGCVATAAAIKCRYHQWPYKGSGTTPSYTYDSDESFKRYTVPENKLGRVYDYDNMPLRYTSSATKEQKAAVAALMHDMGTGCKMMYGWYGSGAYTPDLEYSLKTYFHYDKNLHLEYRDSYNDNTWCKMLVKELDEIGPILYSGVDSHDGGGHEFIFDGYSGTSTFRVNWGWSGSGNGYFNLDLNIPGSYKFNLYQDAILGCKPDKSGIFTPDEVAEQTSFKYNNKIINLSCGIKYDLIVTKEGRSVLEKLNQEAGSTVNFSTGNLDGDGLYKFTIRLSEYYKDFPESQYEFEFEL